MKVKISKIKHLDTALVACGEWGKYNAGVDNGNVSLPVEYTVEGNLIGGVVTGVSLSVCRTKRNDVVCDGVFQTSPVMAFSRVSPNKYEIETKNSLYLLEILD